MQSFAGTETRRLHANSTKFGTSWFQRALKVYFEDVLIMFADIALRIGSLMWGGHVSTRFGGRWKFHVLESEFVELYWQSIYKIIRPLTIMQIPVHYGKCGFCRLRKRLNITFYSAFRILHDVFFYHRCLSAIL